MIKVFDRAFRGFTIIEALIAFSITILLVTLIFQFSAQFYSGLVERSKFNTIYLENYSAFDHIVRNLSPVSGKKENWLKISGNQVIWRDSEGNSANKIVKGYILLDKGLYFVTGTYSSASDTWVSQRKNLLSSTIKDINFVPNLLPDSGDIGSMICSIVFEVKDKSYKLVRVIELKNGIFV